MGAQIMDALDSLSKNIESLKTSTSALYKVGKDIDTSDIQTLTVSVTKEQSDFSTIVDLKNVLITSVSITNRSRKLSLQVTMNETVIELGMTVDNYEYDMQTAVGNDYHFLSYPVYFDAFKIAYKAQSTAIGIDLNVIVNYIPL